MFQKNGGCCSTAKVTGLKPCYYPLAPKTISLLIKITQNSGLSPHAVLYSGFIMLDKRKKSLSKAGGQRYLAIKGHARPCLILLYH
jgi:hypothetical protein